MGKKYKKYEKKTNLLIKEYYIFRRSSILQSLICSSWRFWIFMSVRREEICFILSFPSSIHLSIGKSFNFKVSNFGRISTFPSFSWRIITCSWSSQSCTSISFKFWKLCIKWVGTRLSRHGHSYTLKICRLEKDSNGSWWCHISFSLGKSLSVNSSNLENETYNMIHDIINWKVIININIFLKYNSSAGDYSHVYFNYIYKKKMKG